MRATSAANVRRLRVLLGAAVVGGALLSVSPATPATSAEFVATADSFVSAARPTSNYGGLPLMLASASPSKMMYLRFDVSGIAEGSTAILKLGIAKRDREGLEIRGVNGAWDEATINYRNAPAPGAAVVATGPLEKLDRVTVDVTQLVQQNGPVSFAITSGSRHDVAAATREAFASLRPRLLITTPDPEPEPEPLSPFTVSHDGTQYRAVSATGVVYTGTLKSVVESAALQLAGAGGGVVKFGAGNFDLGRENFEFTQLANVSFEGAGIDSTTITNSSIAALDTEVFDLTRTSLIGIRDLTVVAGGSERSTSDGIDVDGGNETLIERVRVAGSRGRGIVLDGKDVFEGNPLKAENNVVRDCVVSGVPGDGVVLLAASSNRIERCTITNAGRHGISIVKSSGIAGQPNKKPVGNVASANVIRGSGHDGINITSGDRNEILGNVVQNSSAATTVGDGIRLSSADDVTAEGNLVAGNNSGDTRAVHLQRFGLNISSALCLGTVVRENTFSGNRVGPINDLGTGTVYDVSTDTEAPTAPTGVAATAVSAARVHVSWTAATDNVGITGYTVYRDGAPVGTVGATTLTFSDTTVAGATTYSYTVDAFDAVGNHSAESAAAAVTTPAGATISTFDAIADAYVNADAPTTNFGSGDELRTDNTPLIRSFLRFDVAGITGTVTRAKLRIFANSSSSAGFEVHALSATFDETAVTHETAPEVGTLFGTSPAFTAGGYIEVDITSAIGGNGIFEFALTALGDTATSFGSRESANKPQLLIESIG
jgi:parallel beta-helix repeat protein